MRKKSLVLWVALHAVLIGMFSSVILLTSCSKSEEDKQKERIATYYLDEDFVLVSAKEDIAGGDNGNAYKVRTWVIARVVREHPDTIQQAEIMTKVATNTKDDCNCGSKDFLITNELWYGKPIGSKLHFDFIRKDRFFKLPAAKVLVIEEPVLTINPAVTTSSGDKMQVELEILRLERELTLLKEKLKTYENN
jgi:hypothetical protein